MYRHVKNNNNGLPILMGVLKNNNNGLPIFMGMLKIATIRGCQY